MGRCAPSGCESLPFDRGSWYNGLPEQSVGVLASSVTDTGEWLG